MELDHSHLRLDLLETARPYQLRIVSQCCQYLPDLGSALIESATGCLTGDTMVQVNLGGKSKQTTMEDAYLHFHGINTTQPIGLCGCGCGAETNIAKKTYKNRGVEKGEPFRYLNGHYGKAVKWNSEARVRSYKGSYGIGLNNVLDIVQSGVKDVYRITLENGFTLKGTACHPILTTVGWVKLGELDNTHVVLVDNKNPKAQNNDSPKVRDYHIVNLWNHPFARMVRTIKTKQGYTLRVAKHIAVYEAHINNMTIAEYTQTMRFGDPTGLELIDPTVYVVHHKDGNHYNNDPNNLQKMTHVEHNTYHGHNSHYKNFGNFQPGNSQFVSREYIGKEMTYDICCEQPYHNFIANGIVVHNSGKTYMGLKTAEQMTLKDPDLQVIWVAMNPGLLRQARKEVVKFGITNLNLHTVSIMNESQILEVAAATQGKRKLLVCDEAQHAAATSMVHAYSVLEPDYHLGLSATPFRQDKAQLGYRKIIKDASIHRLIADGWLSQFDLHMIPDWEPANVVEVFHSDPEKWGKSAFYFLKMVQARAAYKRLKGYGYKVALIDNENNTGKENIKIIEDFHAGNIDLIVNCMVLTEGFDCCSLNTVFVRDGSKGPVTQMAGRVLRLHDGLPIKNIVQSQKSKYPFSRTTNPHKTYVLRENKWVVSGSSEKAEQAMNETIQRMIGVEVKLPDYITNKLNKSKKKSRGGF